jgi:hypothetical protein
MSGGVPEEGQMADLVLWRDSLPDKRFPPLCMRCGAPSSLVVEHRFLWARGDAAGLWGSLFNLARQDRQTIKVPLCARHRNMFCLRTFLIVLAILAPLVFLAGLILFVQVVGPPPPGGRHPPAVERVEGILMNGFALSLVYVLITMLTWREMAIRAVTIDENYVALTGVSERFVAAIEEPADTAREEFVEGRNKQRRWKGAALFVLGVVSFLLPIAGIQVRVLDELGELRPYASGALILVGLYFLAHPPEKSAGAD